MAAWKRQLSSSDCACAATGAPAVIAKAAHAAAPHAQESYAPFAAGMVVGLATQDKAAKPLRQKIDAVGFGWFFPFFFVGAGVKLHLATFIHGLSTALLVRGTPAWFYGKHLAAPERRPFALFSSVHTSHRR